MIYLALYRGRKTIRRPYDLLARASDWLTRVMTRGPYSHCELVTHLGGGQYGCYSASVRDGGVRHKTMPLPADKWDLIPISSRESLAIDLQAHYAATHGQAYDWPGALGFVLRTAHRPERWFCSEWAGHVLGLPDSWRFSPNDLAAIAKKGERHGNQAV
ncbi:hypothetical protein [Neisseria shayeganii]|uniref:Enoyl-CoA hydratase n=1 Tax=Neisseria shayeganii TaxID=607712 RepID=A0A7D7S7J1_9NEIS|nr:hypothetical protein [Neisseria shayeganii]QMT40011.1 hypothetical protein H3L94_09150 [Neisseria shayeganii]